MKRARFAMEAKCSRVFSESTSICTSYFLRIATPNSSASIESTQPPRQLCTVTLPSPTLTVGRELDCRFVGEPPRHEQWGHRQKLVRSGRDAVQAQPAARDSQKQPEPVHALFLCRIRQVL